MVTEGRNPSDEDEPYEEGEENPEPPVDNEEQENPEPPVDDEEEKLKQDIRDQSRSFFSNVRRKYNGHTFQNWSAEIRKPGEICNGAIMLKSYQTDVEAAVVASVVSRLFEIVAQPIRDENNKSDSSRRPRFEKVILNKPVGCYDYLLNRELAKGNPIPDCKRNDAIRDFVQPCHEHFMELVTAVENKTGPMPEDPSMIEAINLYITKAMRYDQRYPEGGVPPEKQAKPHTKNRKQGTGARNRRGFIELECACDHHPRRKLLKWEFKKPICLCSGLQFRIIPTDPAGSGACQTDAGTSHPADDAHPAGPDNFQAFDGSQPADPRFSHPADDLPPVDPGTSHPNGIHSADPDASQASDAAQQADFAT